MTTTINQPEKLRYSESRLSRVEQTATADYNVTVPVSRLREQYMRDQPVMTEIHHELIAMIVEALEKLDVFQWARSKMAEENPGLGGGEVTLEEPSAAYEPRQHKMSAPELDDHDAKLKLAHDRYQKLREGGPAVMHYQAGANVEQAAQAAGERHDAIEEARTELHECYARSCEASADVSAKAIDYATRHDVTFEDALEKCGGRMPTILA